MWCTTCGNIYAREAISSIEDLQAQLESIDPRRMVSYEKWCDVLRLAAFDNFLIIDWNRVLDAWYDYAAEDITFLDHIFFYIIGRYPVKEEIFKKWERLAVSKALKSENLSLIESIIRVLGEKTAQHKELLELAFEKRGTSKLINDALIKANLN